MKKIRINQSGLALPLSLLFLLCCLCLGMDVFARVLGTTPDQTDLMLRFAPMSSAHPFGTDDLGRDIFLRLLQGGRVSLCIGLVAALLCGAIGMAAGVLAGYKGGAWDAALMRLCDVLIALPLLPLLIILSAIDLGKLGIDAQGGAVALYKIIVLVTAFGWVAIARLARARALTLRRMDFVRAAQALGVSQARIMLRHIAPNLLPTVIVATAMAAGNIILTESVLSFLGLGIQPPMASWGNMLSHAEDTLWDHPWLSVFPGMMIFATVLAFNLLGDGLQQAIDPKRQNR